MLSGQHTSSFSEFRFSYEFHFSDIGGKQGTKVDIYFNRKIKYLFNIRFPLIAASRHLIVFKYFEDHMVRLL